MAGSSLSSMQAFFLPQKAQQPSTPIAQSGNLTFCSSSMDRLRYLLWLQQRVGPEEKNIEQTVKTPPDKLTPLRLEKASAEQHLHSSPRELLRVWCLLPHMSIADCADSRAFHCGAAGGWLLFLQT